MMVPRAPPAPGRNCRMRACPCRTRFSRSKPGLFPPPQGPPPPPLLDWLAIRMPFLWCAGEPVRDLWLRGYRQKGGSATLPARSDVFFISEKPTQSVRHVHQRARYPSGVRAGSLGLGNRVVKVRVVKSAGIKMVDGNTFDSMLDQCFFQRGLNLRGRRGCRWIGHGSGQIRRVSGRGFILRTHSCLLLPIKPAPTPSPE